MKAPTKLGSMNLEDLGTCCTCCFERNKWCFKTRTSRMCYIWQHHITSIPQFLPGCIHKLEPTARGAKFHPTTAATQVCPSWTTPPFAGDGLIYLRFAEVANPSNSQLKCPKFVCLEHFVGVTCWIICFPYHFWTCALYTISEYVRTSRTKIVKAPSELVPSPGSVGLTHLMPHKEQIINNSSTSGAAIWIQLDFHFVSWDACTSV